MTSPGTRQIEDILRDLAPQVLGALVRHYGGFDTCEDAVQEALLAAAMQWPDEGVPENPKAWLIRVASRRLLDQYRAGAAVHPASCPLSEALAGPGGVGLVVKVFCGMPGVVLTPARRGVFRSQPERIQIGDWRYEVTQDGRLSAAHVVNGIVLAENVLAAGAVGPHVARALSQAISEAATRPIASASVPPRKR